jgi:uncharacterized protein YacL
MIGVFRFLFLVSSVFFTSYYFIEVSVKAAVISGIISALIAFIILIIIEYVSHSFSTRLIIAALVGLLLGLTLGNLAVKAIDLFPFNASNTQLALLKVITYHIIGFGIMMFFAINNEDIGFFDKILTGPLEEGIGEISYKILDTSVIIDGRIADICDTGFLEGILVIPNFVLHELQMIADSADSIKRNRGRRGLDILNKMQKDQAIKVKISDMDFPDIQEVDAKLVKLGKVMKAKVVTNDFNLNKVAEFHGVDVLNINQLSNALKPIVLPGEEMHVTLIKEGKDSNQAVGYLDDGTMVVVENGRRKLNEDVDVIVTSVLQTTAGRMIFARIKED